MILLEGGGARPTAGCAARRLPPRGGPVSDSSASRPLRRMLCSRAKIPSADMKPFARSPRWPGEVARSRVYSRRFAGLVEGGTEGKGELVSLEVAEGRGDLPWSRRPWSQQTKALPKTARDTPDQRASLVTVQRAKWTREGKPWRTSGRAIHSEAPDGVGGYVIKGCRTVSAMLIGCQASRRLMFHDGEPARARFNVRDGPRPTPNIRTDVRRG